MADLDPETNVEATPEAPEASEGGAGSVATASAAAVGSSPLKKWNRKIHIYLGLYMLLFLWVFAVSGLFINHPGWLAGQPNRVPTEHAVVMPESGTDLEKAQDVLGQMDLKGEIVFRGVQKPGMFGFIALRPSARMFVSVDLATSQAKLMTVKSKHEVMGVLNELHVFTGVRGIFQEKEAVRDWWPTVIWSFSMDALCVGLVVMVLSSLYMGWQLKQQRVGVLVSFGLGVVVFVYFMWGQQMLV